MANEHLIPVRGVPGRFIPEGNLRFVGWRECEGGECPEAVLPAGKGPADVDARLIIVSDTKAQGGCRTFKLEAKVHGQELRLVRTVCFISAEDAHLRRAVRDGDLEHVPHEAATAEKKK